MRRNGFLAFTLADSSFAYLTADHSYGSGNGLDTGWVLGYLLVALGAIWAILQRRHGDNPGSSTAGWTLPSSGATVGAPGLTDQEWTATQAVRLQPGRFTPAVADRIVSSVGLLLIVAASGISLYDLALMSRMLG